MKGTTTLGLGHRGFGFHNPRHHIGKYLQSHGYETVLAGIDHTAAFEWGYVDPVGHSKVLTPDGDCHAATLGPLVADYLRSRPAGTASPRVFSPTPLRCAR